MSPVYFLQLKNILPINDYTVEAKIIALVIFMVFFAYVVWSTYSKPKGFYKDVKNLPIEKD